MQVLHYARNYDDFEKRVSKRLYVLLSHILKQQIKSNANCRENSSDEIRAIVNINDHDINEHKILAVHTGVTAEEEASEWIKPCMCNLCKSQTPRYLICTDCFQLSDKQVFWCPGKLEAHKKSMYEFFVFSSLILFI